MAPGTSQDTSSPSSGLHGGHHLMIQGTYLDADFRLVRGHLGTVFSGGSNGIPIVWGLGGLEILRGNLGSRPPNVGCFLDFLGDFLQLDEVWFLGAAVCRKCWLLNSISWAVLLSPHISQLASAFWGPSHSKKHWVDEAQSAREEALSQLHRGGHPSQGRRWYRPHDVVPRSFEQGDRRRNGNTQNDRLKKNSWGVAKVAKPQKWLEMCYADEQHGDFGKKALQISGATYPLGGHDHHTTSSLVRLMFADAHHLGLGTRLGQIQNENHLWNLVRNYNVTSLQATYVLVSWLLLWFFCHDQVYRHHY